jgi:hypothetical protein
MSRRCCSIVEIGQVMEEEEEEVVVVVVRPVMRPVVRLVGVRSVFGADGTGSDQRCQAWPQVGCDAPRAI